VWTSVSSALCTANNNPQNGTWLHKNYRIAGNFRGVQFLRFSRISGYLRKVDPGNKVRLYGV
jgi:hypothetical protein